MLITKSNEESLVLNNQQKVLNILGLAQCAGKLISGEELVVKSIQRGQAKLVFLAQDAGPNLSKKIRDKSDYFQTHVSTALTTLDISTAIGKPRKVVAVTDAGFVKKMRSIMQ